MPTYATWALGDVVTTEGKQQAGKKEREYVWFYADIGALSFPFSFFFSFLSLPVFSWASSSSSCLNCPSNSKCTSAPAARVLRD